MPTNRREFLQTSMLGVASAAGASGAAPRSILIQLSGEATFRLRLGQRELLRGLLQLQPRTEVRFAGADYRPAGGDLLFVLRVDRERFHNPETYSISAETGRVVLSAATEQALLYAVFDFLERQGAFFGIDGESYPLNPAAQLRLPPPDQPWNAAPRFAVRGLLPWPDFLNCITVYNREDFRAYFEAMLRMRFNTFGMHVYGDSSQWTESYLSFEFAGTGHLAFLDTSTSHRHGQLPQRTSTYAMGAAQFYDGEVFGADVARFARGPWDEAERVRRLLREALDYARLLGIHTGIGFEPYHIPEEIWRALPPEVKSESAQPLGTPRRRLTFDIESITARDLLEARLGQLLEAYPEVEDVWLWEDEAASWAAQRGTNPSLSVTPFLQAHSFLQRHAPKKRLVLAGWGGVTRHFEDLHKRLPPDIVFSALTDTQGWDPVDEAFGKLEGRERWPVPWLEDDPSMWLPQLHVHRFENDMQRAERFGCQGLLGIHWRHRIVDPNAGYQSRASWDRDLKPAEYYAAYARSQAAGARAPELARVLDDADRGRRLLSSGTGEVNNGHAVKHRWAADPTEAFTIAEPYEPEPAVVQSQKEVAVALRKLADSEESPAEKERLDYLAGFVGYMVPYTESWILGHRLQLVLDDAAKIKKEGRKEEASEKVRREAVPLWLALAPQVRRAMLYFQGILATRNDLGQLASMQSKYVRVALTRLRLSIKEYLGEMPAEVQTAFENATRPPASDPSRLIVPTRSTMLAGGQKIRLMAIVPGSAPVKQVLLHTRPRGKEWTIAKATLVARRTWDVPLGPFPASYDLVEYFLSVETAASAGGRIAAPAGAPARTYCVTVQPA